MNVDRTTPISSAFSPLTSSAQPSIISVVITTRDILFSDDLDYEPLQEWPHNRLEETVKEVDGDQLKIANRDSPIMVTLNTSPKSAALQRQQLTVSGQLHSHS